MGKLWDQAALQSLIDNGVEESLTLDYKAAGALEKSDGKKKEITKDVSALANSSGGILIYGIREFADKEREHLPEKLDPIKRTDFSRESLEQVILTIQPRIDGIIIHSVDVDADPNHVIYVVEVPQSTNAHQAKDCRYYKRFNFASVPMEDYEVRDVMNRPVKTDVDFEISLYHVTTGFWEDRLDPGNGFSPKLMVRNSGKRLVRHLKVIINLVGNPLAGDLEDFEDGKVELEGLVWFGVLDTTAVKCSYPSHKTRITFQPGEVLFPDEEIDIAYRVNWIYYCDSNDIEWPSDDEWRKHAKEQGWSIEWILYADDMPFKQGKVQVWELPIVRDISAS